MNNSAFCFSFNLKSVYSTFLQVNIIPSLAEAYVNLRIHSAQTLQEVRTETLFLFLGVTVNFQVE